MDRIDAKRLRTVTDARPHFAALLDDAQAGEATHFVRGSHVVAHLIPPNTLVLGDERVLQTLVAATARRAIEAWSSAHDGQSGSVREEVTQFVRALAWLKTNPSDYTTALTIHAAALALHLGEPTNLGVDTVFESLGGTAAQAHLGSSDDLRQDIALALAGVPEVIEVAHRAAQDADGRYFSPLARMVRALANTT